MSRSTRYSPELRERAVRMVIDNRSDYPSEWAALTGISKLFGMSAETLRTWVRRTQVDTGSRPGLTTDERARLKQLERENKDLKRANAILKDASMMSNYAPPVLDVGIGYRVNDFTEREGIDSRRGADDHY